MTSSAPLPPTAPRPPAGAAAPTLLPVLERGRHRDPSRGACIMEYTSLLAGEPFTDHPRCVDPELARVLRMANDTLTDAERPALVPLLGRAIGLVVPAPLPETSGRWFLRWLRRTDVETSALVGRLHRSVLERFVAATGAAPVVVMSPWYSGYANVSDLLWDLVTEPPAPPDPTARVDRIVQRLELLHACYEEAMAELGIGRGSEQEHAGPDHTGPDHTVPDHAVPEQKAPEVRVPAPSSR